MGYQRSNGHTVSNLTVHLVWSRKYRFSVLEGDIQTRCRHLLIQICDSEDVEILKGEGEGPYPYACILPPIFENK